MQPRPDRAAPEEAAFAPRPPPAGARCARRRSRPPRCPCPPHAARHRSTRRRAGRLAAREISSGRLDRGDEACRESDDVGALDLRGARVDGSAVDLLRERAVEDGDERVGTGGEPCRVRLGLRDIRGPDRGEQLCTRPECPVQTRAAEAGRGGDVLERCVDALRLEHLSGGGDQRFAVPCGVGARAHRPQYARNVHPCTLMTPDSEEQVSADRRQGIRRHRWRQRNGP